MRKNSAQAVIEYSIVLGLVVAIMVGMQFYLKRGIQAAVRISADELGEQAKGLPVINLSTGVVEDDLPEGATVRPLQEQGEQANFQREEVMAGGKTVKSFRELERPPTQDELEVILESEWYPEEPGKKSRVPNVVIDDKGTTLRDKLNHRQMISQFSGSAETKYIDPRDGKCYEYGEGECNKDDNP